MATTYNNLYLDLRRKLKAEGSRAPSLEARELLCFASGKTREEFFRDQALYATDEVEQKAHELTGRLLAGEPVAYLIGEWEFFGVTLTITPDVLIPRPDTEVLAQQTIDRMQAYEGGGRLLDLCAGSGCVGLAAASQVPSCRAVLVDVSQEAIQVCRQNIRRSRLTGRVTCFCADAAQDPPLAFGTFDVIACNPPYIPTGDIPGLEASVREYEPHLALDGGADGLDFYRTVLDHWTAALRPGGRLLFEVGIGQADDVAAMMERHGYEDIVVYPDSAGIQRVVEGRFHPVAAPEANGNDGEELTDGR